MLQEVKIGLKDIKDFPIRATIILLIVVAAFWSGSSKLYYMLVDALALENGYDDAPFLFTAFYLFWAACVAFIFRRALFEGYTMSGLVRQGFKLFPVLVFFGAYVALILPLLPEISEDAGPKSPPEFMFASGWYYLPKAADILFQQALIASMIFVTARRGVHILVIAIGMACLFGGYHLMLNFDGFTSLYVARFTLAATLFGLVLPYLYLKVRNGFLWAYGLHCSAYALDATITHFTLSV